MPKKGQRSEREPIGDPTDPQGFEQMMSAFFEWMRYTNYSPRTIDNRQVYLDYFIAWCIERGLTQPAEITKPIIERYQRWMYHYRKKNGEPLSFRSQHSRLIPIRAFFKWLARNNHILY